MSTMSEVKIEEVALTEIEVCEELRRIDPSKASGPDEIPGRLLMQSHNHDLLHFSSISRRVLGF